jgi:hypothetical protein
MNGKKRYGPSGVATRAEAKIDEHEKELLRHEFEVMRRCGFLFLEEIGAATAEEYIIKISSLEFPQEGIEDEE